jgi:diguanylate cyclase (GGDEF)-like protein
MADGAGHQQTHPRVRAIDASARTLAVETVRAVAGLLVAFTLSWWIGGELHLRAGLAGYAAAAGVFLVVAVCTLTVTSGLPIQKALAAQRQSIAEKEEELRAEAAAHQFSADLHEALEMAEHESDVHRVVGRALGRVGDGPGELLLADSSHTHILESAVSVTGGSPGCDVATPWGCPAVRRGQSLAFSDNRALATCPHLQVRETDGTALCVPVAILGTPAGVLHLTADDAELLDGRRRVRVETLAAQTGDRLGLLRAMATSQLAAATDSLTGHLNRRSLEDHLRRLDGDRTPYAVAFADLDHFKVLNDTYGHASGDAALRHFSTVTATAVRTSDLVCRFGGEEFLVVFVGCDVTQAAPIVHRLRSSLGASIAAAGVPPFTVSIGMADSTYADDAAAVIACADAALLAAKREGRDRIVIAPPPDPEGQESTRTPTSTIA